MGIDIAAERKEKKQNKPNHKTLTQCPACEKTVSISATTCPGCGHPIKKQKNKAPKRAGAKYEGTGFILILLSIVLLISGKFEPASLFGIAGFIIFLFGRFK